MKFEAHALRAILSPDRSLLAITGPNPDVQIWRVEGGILLYRLKDTHSPTYFWGREIFGSPKYHSSADFAASWKTRMNLPFPESNAGFIAFSPDSEHLVAGGWSSENNIKLWYSFTGENYAKFVPPATLPKGAASHEADRIVALSFSADGQRVLCATTFHTWSWDIATGKVTDTPPTDEMGNLIKKYKGMFSLDGESIAFETYMVGACIFAGNSSGGPMTRIMIPDSLLWAWTLSPDGRVVATVTFEITSRILGFWDTASGELLYSTSTSFRTFIIGDWSRPFDNIKGLSFSADTS